MELSPDRLQQGGVGPPQSKAPPAQAYTSPAAGEPEPAGEGDGDDADDGEEAGRVEEPEEPEKPEIAREDADGEARAGGAGGVGGAARAHEDDAGHDGQGQRQARDEEQPLEEHALDNEVEAALGRVARRAVDAGRL